MHHRCIYLHLFSFPVVLTGFFRLVDFGFSSPAQVGEVFTLTTLTCTTNQNKNKTMQDDSICHTPLALYVLLAALIIVFIIGMYWLIHEEPTTAKRATRQVSDDVLIDIMSDESNRIF